MAQIPNPFGENNDPQGSTEGRNAMPYAGLASYVMSRVRPAREKRDSRFRARWDEYTRLWRGFWTEKDKSSDSERSKLISPALQQAVEMTVAEMEEAVFNREAWFDVADDIRDEEKQDALAARDQLLEDFTLDGVPDAISKVFLLGAVYGTGIAKINVKRKAESQMVEGQRIDRPRVAVDVEAIRPDEFVIDPSALTIDEAEFCAHEIVRPIWSIEKKMADGAYRRGPVTPYGGNVQGSPDGTSAGHNDKRERGALITEYYGLVPGRMIPGAGGGMVEAIVTILNEGQVLKAVKSPFTMKDRPVVAYQHDSVPGEFWGRGVCEKGFNPQKALDAELRARIDALAFISAPMMGADVTRIPRNGDFRVRPGKTVFTRGRPSEILEPVSFSQPGILAHTFQQTSDLERMVQMATGAMDSATPVGMNSRNETASGMSMLQGGFIKRSKRTMQNLERQFLTPLVRKSLWRYMQFDPGRYPQDYKLMTYATMGIMAKEVENSQLVNMLGFLTPEDPARQIIIKAIFENTASANKQELMQAFEQMAAPPSEEQQQMQQQMQQMQMAQMQATLEEQQLQNAKLQAEIEKIRSETNFTDVKAELEDDKVEIQAANAVTAAEKARVARDQVTVAQQRNQIDARKEATRGNNGDSSS